MGPNTTIPRRFGTFCGIWRRFEIFDFFDFLVVKYGCGHRQLDGILAGPRTKQGGQDVDGGTSKAKWAEAQRFGPVHDVLARFVTFGDVLKFSIFSTFWSSKAPAVGTGNWTLY